MSFGRHYVTARNYHNGSFGRGSKGSSTVRADSLLKDLSKLVTGVNKTATSALSSSVEYMPWFKMSFDEDLNVVPFAAGSQQSGGTATVVLQSSDGDAAVSAIAQRAAQEMLSDTANTIAKQIGGLVK